MFPIPNSVKAQVFTGIGSVSNIKTNETLFFKLNPNSITRARSAMYVAIPGAQADYTGSYDSRYLPFEWQRNNPEVITFELLLVNLARNGEGFGDVENDLEMLDRFMEKDSLTAQPADLLFVYGKRHDLVRIFNKTVQEKIHTKDLRVQLATCHLTLQTIKARRK